MEALWEQIRLEYIAGGTSYRRLAQKYGVSVAAVKTTGKQEGWVAQKKSYEKKAEEALTDTCSYGEAERISRFLTVTDKLLEKVAALTEREDTITPANLKTLSDVMKNIKEVQMIRSHRELLEQDVRIEKLRRELGKAEVEGNAITVTLEGTQEFAG